MAKQFIRHLEFYGFPDCNGYSSDITGAVDLSDIIKKNEEQDKAIACLSKSEWASKKELHHLNGKLNTFMHAQNMVNYRVGKELISIDRDISNLKENSNAFAEELSAITDTVNGIIGDVDIISGKVTTIEENISAITEDVETLSAETINGFASVNGRIDEYGRYVEMVYAKKDSVYTKAEIEEKFEPYATRNWVISQGYITMEEGDRRYATNYRVDDLERILETANGKIAVIRVDLDNLSGSTETRFETVNGKIVAVENALNDLATHADERLDSAESRLFSAETKIGQDEINISNLYALKADKSELSTMYGEVEADIARVENKLLSKVSLSAFDDYRSAVSSRFDELDSMKADKTYVDTLGNRITIVANSVTREQVDRADADVALSNRIINNANDITNIISKNAEQDTEIAILDDKISQEVEDRIAADDALIGSTADTLTANTINGAKKYADNARNTAQNYADDAADAAEGRANSYTDSQFNNIEQALSAKASKGYVDAGDTQVRSDVSTQIAAVVTEFNDRISQISTNLSQEVDDRVNNDISIDNKVSVNTSKLGAITTWNGSDPTQYNDNGNGVLDAMHRELHTLNVNFGKLIQQLRDNYDINIEL